MFYFHFCHIFFDYLDKNIDFIQPQGWVKNKNEIVWIFKNLKPTPDHNIKIEMPDFDYPAELIRNQTCFESFQYQTSLGKTYELTEKSMEGMLPVILDYAWGRNIKYDLGYNYERSLRPSDYSRFKLNVLRYLRNYIYAEHGRKFESPDLVHCFATFIPEKKDQPLSEIEKANIKYIQGLEKELSRHENR